MNKFNSGFWSYAVVVVFSSCGILYALDGKYEQAILVVMLLMHVIRQVAGERLVFLYEQKVEMLEKRLSLSVFIPMSEVREELSGMLNKKKGESR